MKYKHLVSLSLLCFAWLLLSQGLFRVLQQSVAARMADSIDYQVKESVATGNMDKIATSLTNLESLQLVRCIKLILLSEPTRVILDTTYAGSCTPNSWLLHGQQFSEKLTSLNGQTWSLSFVTLNQNLFTIALALTRLLGLLIVIASYLIFRLLYRAEQTLMEIELKASEQIRQIAQQVAHDIRSPLTYLKQISSGREIDLTSINTAIERIEGVANDLLKVKWNDLKSNSKALQKENVIRSSELRLILERVVEEKRVNLLADSRAGISVNLKWQLESADRYIQAEADKFARVVSNLISNSVESITESGIVTLTVFPFGLEKMRIAIQDDGIGMKPDQLDRLGREEFTTKVDGHGLGFMGVKFIVENEWKGSLKVRSKINLGSLVEIDLYYV